MARIRPDRPTIDKLSPLSLAEQGFEIQRTKTITAEAGSTRSAVVVELEYEDSQAGFNALGERGDPAEEVAGSAVAVGTEK